MIIQQQKNEAEYIGNVVENKVGIDAKNIDFIATLLTSNLYSKPFASFLRETVSNAYDSHIEAGTNDHILLLLEEGDKYDTIRVSIRDYGVGISPERFERIYRNIGSSTKRESNDFIGCFGIGRFSCLSCADVANITSYYNGVKYSYVMYKNNGGINIDKLSQETGNYKNGLEVSVVTSVDKSEFDEAISYLSLFENLYIENKLTDYRYRATTTAFNERKVVNKGNFTVVNGVVFRGYGKNYVALGKVIYPLDRSSIDTSGIIINIPIGSVDVTPNRESLQFSNKTRYVLDKQIAIIKKSWSDAASKILGNTDLYTFYKFATENSILIGDVKVDKSDITLDTSIVKINGDSIPEGYDVFLSRLKYANIPRETIYKTVYTTKSRRFVTFRDILNKDFNTGLKMDSVTKNTTMMYFRNTYGNSIIFCYSNIPDLVQALSNSMNNALYNINATQLKTGLLFTFLHQPIIQLSNSVVPQTFIEEYRKIERQKKAATDIKFETVRIYNDCSYRQFDLEMWLKNLKHIPFVVYAVNSRDNHILYQKIADLLNYYYDGSRWKHPEMITVKSSMIPLLSSRKKFVNITDFLYLRNNFWSKMITAEIIYSKFINKEFGGLDFLRISSVTPMWTSFQAKYHKQLRCYSQLIELPIYQDIKNLYLEKGWVNKYDISRFSLNDQDIQIIKEIDSLQSKKSELLYALIFKKYGKNSKVGVNAPSSSIYKYIKNECIQK